MLVTWPSSRDVIINYKVSSSVHASLPSLSWSKKKTINFCHVAYLRGHYHICKLRWSAILPSLFVKELINLPSLVVTQLKNVECGNHCRTAGITPQVFPPLLSLFVSTFLLKGHQKDNRDFDVCVSIESLTETKKIKRIKSWNWKLSRMKVCRYINV